MKKTKKNVATINLGKVGLLTIGMALAAPVFKSCDKDPIEQEQSLGNYEFMFDKTTFNNPEGLIPQFADLLTKNDTLFLKYNGAEDFDSTELSQTALGIIAVTNLNAQRIWGRGLLPTAWNINRADSAYLAGIRFDVQPAEYPCAELEREVAGLEAKLDSAAQDVRNAIVPALTEPDDIQPSFWTLFRQANQNPQSFFDTVLAIDLVIIHLHQQLGTPLPWNDSTLSILQNNVLHYQRTWVNLYNADESLDLCRTENPMPALLPKHHSIRTAHKGRTR